MSGASRTDGSQASRGWLLRAIRADLRLLHAVWVGLLFVDPRSEGHPVVGEWRPSGLPERAAYRSWSLLGVPLVALTYPVVLAGFIVRFYVTRMDRFARRVGLIGVVLTSVLVWSALSLAAYVREFPVEGLLAVVAAGGVATVSAVLAWVCSRLDGRPVSILLAYPFGVTAVFLPPVVAGLYSETVAAVVFARSDVLAIWLLDSVLAVGGLATFLRDTFDLVGIAYVGMWFGLAVPVGWALGLVVALADAIRPAGESREEATAG